MSSIGLAIRGGIRSSLILCVWYHIFVAFFPEHFTFKLQLYVQFIIEHNRSVVISLLTWVMTAKYMTLSGQFVWMYSISTFAGP